MFMFFIHIYGKVTMHIWLCKVASPGLLLLLLNYKMPQLQLERNHIETCSTLVFGCLLHASRISFHPRCLLPDITAMSAELLSREKNGRCTPHTNEHLRLLSWPKWGSGHDVLAVSPGRALSLQIQVRSLGFQIRSSIIQVRVSHFLTRS